MGKRIVAAAPTSTICKDEMSAKLQKKHFVPKNHNAARVKNRRVKGWVNNRLE